MKKHQKVLLGLMALGLAGGVGTTLALTRNAAEQSSINGGTDQAIYLNWGGSTETNVVSAIESLAAKETQYRYLVVSPKATNKLSGTVSVNFSLTVPEGNVITGLTVDVYKTDTYKKESPVTSTSEESKTAPDSLVCTLKAGNLTGTSEIAVDGSDKDKANPTAYYTLAFTWDGSDIATSETFGASLKISQSFTEAVNA